MVEWYSEEQFCDQAMEMDQHWYMFPIIYGKFYCGSGDDCYNPVPY